MNIFLFQQRSGNIAASFTFFCLRAVILAVLVLTANSLVASAAPPNIVVILGDDIGWGDIRAYNPNSPIPTPNLDQLAQDGMRFTNAHTSGASCAPTRYSLLTGNYQWRGRRSFGTWNYQDDSQILENQLTFADVARSRGYATAFIGKMHLGGDFFEKGTTLITRDEARVDFSRPFGDGPLAHGFDYSFTLLEGIQSAPYAYFENDRLFGDQNLLRQWLPGTYGQSKIDQPGIGMPYWDSSKVGADLMTRALKFINRHRGQYGATKPFLLYYAAASAHAPFSPPDAFFGQPVRGVTGLCPRQDMVHELDLAVGTLIAKLRGNGALRNTLIVFTSDNGGNDICGVDSSGPTFSGHKFLIQEGGHRVPFIARWGDGSFFRVPRGTVRDQLIGVHDLAATISTIVGYPPAADQARDSYNILPVLLGTTPDTSPVRDHLIAESRQDSLGRATPPTFAYYEGGWKLIVRLERSVFTPLSLYNVELDTAELSDVSAANASLVSSMLERFKEKYAGPRSAP
jgi:arylsulfatase A-like enzyme